VYGMRLEQIRKVVSTLSNVKFLEQESFTLPGTSVTILGCVLWTDVPAASESVVGRSMNDYACIYDIKRDESDGKDKTCAVTVNDLRQKHIQSVAWLTRSIETFKAEQALQTNPNARLIVMTHHLPSFQLISPHYRTSPINPGYATDLESTCLQSPIALWICGHSHYFRRIKINGVQCIINPSGAVDEDTGVQRGMVYTLE
jgi:hypothetical protein